MPRVVFAVPYALESTLKFVRGAAALPGVELALLSQEAAERLPRDVMERAVAFERVPNMLDADQLEKGVRALAKEMGGPVDRIIGILEQLQGPLADVRERLRIRGMDQREATQFRDKSVMKTALRDAGIPCARHCLAESGEEALTFGAECGFPLVVKPPDGAGAKNTFRVESAEQLRDLMRSLPPNAEQPTLLEEFVRGEEHSFDAVTLRGEHVFHSISRYAPTPLEVMESPWIQWCVYLPRDVSGPEYDDIREAGGRTLEVLGMVNGFSHMEWFRRPDGTLAISEVAARPPGAQFTSLISYAHERDFYQEWARILTFEEFDPPERKYACGAAYLRGQGQGDRVALVEGLEQAQSELGELVVEAKLPRVGQPKASSYEGEGYVILRHPETEVVVDGLQRLVSMVRVQMA